MKNIALILRYDGSRYHGWQVQKNEISVAQTLEEALSKTCGHRVKAVGCGRTDAGVHARPIAPISTPIPGYLWTGCLWQLIPVCRRTLPFWRRWRHRRTSMP
ncbi:MAG: hypothetical protein V8T45_08305 [Oscillospiraceae bacterium]